MKICIFISRSTDALKFYVLDRYRMPQFGTGNMVFYLFIQFAAKSCLQAPGTDFVFIIINPICITSSSNGQQVRLTVPQ